MVTSGAPLLQACVNSLPSTYISCRHSTRAFELQCTQDVCAEELVVSIWYMLNTRQWRSFSNNKPRTTCISKNQPTVKRMQSTTYQLRPRESSTGVNYAAYMYHGLCISMNHQPSTLINHQNIRTSDEGPSSARLSASRTSICKTNSFDRKTKNASASNFIPKTAFVYLNILGAKTTQRRERTREHLQRMIIQPPHPRLTRHPSPRHHSHTNSQTTPGGTHSHHSHQHPEPIEGQHNYALTHPKAPTSVQFPT
jgi:hypothetical protein